MAAVDDPDALLRVAYRFVRQAEGGFSDDPRDPGGPTQWGITQAAYDGFRRRTSRPPAPVTALTEAEAEQYYRTQVWEPAHCALLPAALAIAHFDGSVHAGLGPALMILQRTLGVEADGRWGPVTARAVAAARGDWPTLTAYLLERARHLARVIGMAPTLAYAVPGWFNRLRALARTAGAYCTPGPS
jgi:lysozyme family protein